MAHSTTPLQDSLLILLTLSGSIDEFFIILEKEHHNKESVIYAAVSGQVLLQVCALKEELNVLLGNSEASEKVSKVRDAIKLCLKRINQWTDLEKFRNTFIAHRFRENGVNRLVTPYNQELNIPNQFPDYIVLCGCVNYVQRVILYVFMQEVRNLAPIVATRQVPRLKIGYSSIEEASKELDRLCPEISF